MNELANNCNSKCMLPDNKVSNSSLANSMDKLVNNITDSIVNVKSNVGIFSYFSYFSFQWY
ncbi:hypothetical protein [Methanococcus voltae]|uniref:Uncharacterized protein n=2 Tax=Methanococcus voltae TaxID=2188 RepID=A0A8J7RHJ0_METVO|nr:hypothetical protein [Methanococcus voltae]MBP2172977.1 hypothetical protein [Methanococcus voltae]MBP2201967.1 hypothetical protein [Methanococcus voltae]MCS3922130.1 hypothetical protein [Methanococcus voltae PS]